jgi:putative ABC transport system permease protein
MANLAASNLWQRKGRSAISIFGIAIGVGLLLVLKGMLMGTIDEVTTRMKNTGADIFVYYKLEWVGATEGMPLFWADKIQENLSDKIESITLIIQDKIQQIGNVKVENRVWGVQSSDLPKLNVKLLQDGKSRYFNDGQYEMLIDQRLSQHSGLKIGDKAPYLGREWTIVGITEIGVGVRVYVPFDILQGLKGLEKRASIFAIKLKPGVDAEMVGAAVKNIPVNIPGQPGETMNLPVEPIIASSMYETFREKAGIIDTFANYVTLVALIISFLMILLTMYTVVVERTRDIGILKSLGASRMFIARNIIMESLALCVLGVGVGILLSVAASKVIPMISMLDVSISFEWVMVAAGLGLAGGVLGALVPAMLAANKDPVVAITYE